MAEHIPENDLPLNVQAKQALKLAKADYDSSGLYLLQLIEWALDHGKVDLPGPHTAQNTLKEFVEAFWTWKKPRVMQVFLEDSDGNPVEVYPKGPLDPARFAQALIDQLDGRLTEALPDYPTAFKAED